MRTIFSLLGFLFFLSCTGTDKVQDEKQSINGSWVVVSIGEKELGAPGVGDLSGLPQLDIQVAERRYNGSDGCNRLMGGLIEVGERTIRFGVSAGTQMMCPEMEIPDLFNRTLGKVQTWKIKKNQLQLFDEHGKELMQLKKTD